MMKMMRFCEKCQKERKIMKERAKTLLLECGHRIIKKTKGDEKSLSEWLRP